MYTRMKY